MMNRICLLLPLLAVIVVPCSSRGADAVSFRAEIAPILLNRCLACHGRDKAEGNYRVDSFERLMKAGDSGLTPLTASDLEDSETYRRVASEDESERMPLDADPLTDAQVALLRRWIEEGARFDGPDAAAPLSSVVPTVVHPDPPEVYTATIPIMALTFSPDGDALIVGGYRELTVWNPTNGELIRRVKNIGERTYALAMSPDGKLLAVACGVPGQLGEVRLLSWPEGNLSRVCGTTTDVTLDVAFSPDGTRLASASADGSIRVFQTETGAPLLEIPAHADWALAVAFNGDGSRLASASRDKTAKVFDAATGEALVTYSDHGQVVHGVAFDPDNQSVYSGGEDRKIHLWSATDGKKTAEITGFGGEVYALRISDKYFFATSADRSARQYDLQTRQQIRSLTGLSDWVLSTAYLASGPCLATGCFDGEVRVWRLEDGSEACRFIAAPGYYGNNTTQTGG